MVNIVKNLSLSMETKYSFLMQLNTAFVYLSVSLKSSRRKLAL